MKKTEEAIGKVSVVENHNLQSAVKTGGLNFFKGVAVVMIILEQSIKCPGISPKITLPMETLAELFLFGLFIVDGFNMERVPFRCLCREIWRKYLKAFLLAAVAAPAFFFCIQMLLFRAFPAALHETLSVFAGFMLGQNPTAGYFGRLIYSCGPAGIVAALAAGSVLFNWILKIRDDRIVLALVIISAVIGTAAGRRVVLPFCVLQAFAAVPGLYAGYLAKKQGFFEKKPGFLFTVSLPAAAACLCVGLKRGGLGILELRYPFGALSLLSCCAVSLAMVRVAAGIKRSGGFISVFDGIGRSAVPVICLHAVENTAAHWYYYIERHPGRPALTALFIFLVRCALIAAAMSVMRILRDREKVFKIETRGIMPLQSVRAAAFLAVLFYHCGTNVSGGATGVMIFFVMSGFLMSVNYAGKEPPTALGDSVRFSWNKIRKLAPLHVLTLLVMAYYVKKDFSWYLSIPNLLPEGSLFLLNAALLQSWIPADSVYFSYNGVAWFLSAITFCYFSFPYLMRRLESSRSSRLPLVLLLVLPLIEGVTGYLSKFVRLRSGLFLDGSGFETWFSYIFPPFRAMDFLFGCALGLLWLRTRDRIKQGPWEAAALELSAPLLFVLLELVFRKNTEKFLYYRFITGPAMLLISGMLVFTFASGKGYLSKVLTWKPVLYLGQISGIAFLVHYPMMLYLDRFCSRFLGRTLPPWPKSFAVLLLTVSASVVYGYAEDRIKSCFKAEDTTGT